MTKHSTTVGGSSAARIIQCPSSGWLDRQLDKPRESNSYADRGSMLHAAMEQWLRTGVVPAPGWHCHDTQLTQELIEEKIDPAGEAFDKLFDLCPGEGREWIEQRVQLDRILGAFGTVDYAAVAGNTLLALDWKFGDGVIVDPKENKQGMFYACGLLDQFSLWDKIDKVVIAIIQPTRGYEPLRYWETDTKRLADFYDELKDAVDKSDSDQHFAEGDGCRFCPVLAECPLKQSTLHELEDVWGAAGNPGQLTDEDLGDLLERADYIQDWAKALQAEAASRIEEGLDVPGWKLVAKRKLRKWADESEVWAWCKKRRIPQYKFTERKVLTPAKLEKVVKFPAELLHQGEAGATLTRSDDPRPALTFDLTETLQEALK